MRTRKPRKGGLEKAIAAKGNLTALAEALRMTIQAVSQWNEIPAERCQDVHRVTGVPLHELRPDIYGVPTPHPTMRTDARSVA